MDVSDAFNNNHSNTDTDNAGDKNLSEACWRHNKCIELNSYKKKKTRLARLQSDSGDDCDRDDDDGMSDAGDDDKLDDRTGEDDEGRDDRCQR
ncbi:hypothetical protein DY000_02015085 [Brassica cretica]|uniref:Uncharacterized protein n=1 Tax=Brassica cretica TaxID=69181 RepID=A0ABQ7CQE0_BRACR|nr:hypothetical protein DY000_02015085 [Brassica cretica]